MFSFYLRIGLRTHARMPSEPLRAKSERLFSMRAPRGRVGMELYCERHLSMKPKDEKLAEAQSHVLSIAMFRSEAFATMLDEVHDQGLEETGEGLTPLEFAGRINERWQKEHPCACCFLGDEEVKRLQGEELTKALLWGTEAEPVEASELADLGLTSDDIQKLVDQVQQGEADG